MSHGGDRGGKGGRTPSITRLQGERSVVSYRILCGQKHCMFSCPTCCFHVNNPQKHYVHEDQLSAASPWYISVNEKTAVSRVLVEPNQLKLPWIPEETN